MFLLESTLFELLSFIIIMMASELLDPWDFWKNKLKSPKYILAPMVDHSELPWRMLSREFGCQVAYTPMFHAANFASSKKYRSKYFSTSKDDRPLIVQFCANNPDTLLEAANYVKDDCDAIDINLGCPQEIARRGKYGAFLQEDWALIESMVQKLLLNLGDQVAVSCKIRRLETVDETVKYAKMLEKAGCHFIGIHGRTREQRGCKTGLADWSHIKAVKDSLTIPVIANGNIQSGSDANKCLEFTNADAVMTAEGNLYNPALFLDKHYPAWEMAKKYLDYMSVYPIAAGMAKSHVFKLFHRCVSMEENVELRNKLGQANSLDKLFEIVDAFETKYRNQTNESQIMDISTLPVPPYLTQAHYRYEPQSKASLNDDKSNENQTHETQLKRRL